MINRIEKNVWNIVRFSLQTCQVLLKSRTLESLTLSDKKRQLYGVSDNYLRDRNV